MLKQKSRKYNKLFFALIFLIALIFILGACSKQKFRLTFYLHDMNDPWWSVEVKRGHSLEQIPKPENTSGYMFNGWYLDKDKWNIPFDKTYVVNSDLTIYGKYIKQDSSLKVQYRISFNIDGISPYKININEGELPKLGIPKLNDKVFEDWYLDSEFKVVYENKPISQNLILYGKWSERTYNEFFNFNSENNEILGLASGIEVPKKIFIPSKINNIEVKKIANHAFKDMLIENLIIEIGIESIGLSSFDGCSLLTSVKLPESILYIGKSAFKNCKRIENIQLSSAISKIEDSTFQGCEKLKTINITAKILEIGEYAFQKTALTDLTIPSSITKIGKKSFWQSKLNTLIFRPNSNSLNIDDEAFSECRSLNSVVFDSYNHPSTHNITIGAKCFHSCSNLTEVLLPDNIEKILQSAFAQCSKLSTVELPKNNFSDLENDLFASCENLTSVVMSDNIENIKTGVFAGCAKLSTVALSSNLKVIGKNAFHSCTNLKVENSHLLKKLTEIGEGAFANCNALAKFYITENVITIGAEAFRINQDITFVVYTSLLSKQEKWADNWILNEEQRVKYNKTQEEYLSI